MGEEIKWRHLITKTKLDLVMRMSWMIPKLTPKKNKMTTQTTAPKKEREARNERRRKAKSPTRRRKSAKMIVIQMPSLKLNQSWSQLQQKARKVKVVNLSKMNKQTRICQQLLNCAKIIV